MDGLSCVKVSGANEDIPSESDRKGSPPRPKITGLLTLHIVSSPRLYTIQVTLTISVLPTATPTF
jgi:hypothetical protein